MDIMTRYTLWLSSLLLLVVLAIPCRAEEVWTMPEIIDCGSYTIHVALKHIPQSPTTISRKEAVRAGCKQDPRGIYDLSVLFTPEELESGYTLPSSSNGDITLIIASKSDDEKQVYFGLVAGNLIAHTPLGSAIRNMDTALLSNEELDWMTGSQAIQEMHEVCSTLGIQTGDVYYIQSYDCLNDELRERQNTFGEDERPPADFPSFYLIKSQILVDNLPMTTCGGISDGKYNYSGGYVTYIRSENRVEAIFANGIYQSSKDIGKPVECMSFEQILPNYQRFFQQQQPDTKNSYILVGAFVSYLKVSPDVQASNVDQLFPVWTFVTKIVGADDTKYLYAMFDAENGMPIMHVVDQEYVPYN